MFTVDAELATTPETRTHGLMERASLPADHGMLFIFEVAQPLQLLDVQYADSTGYYFCRCRAAYHIHLCLCASLPTTVALSHV